MNKIIVFLGAAMFLVAAIVFLWWNHGYQFKECQSYIDKTFAYDGSTSKETYQNDVEQEIFKKIRFPMQEPFRAVVHQNNFWRPWYDLSKAQFSSVLKFLNDPNAYDWGEIGTPYFDKYIAFYGQAGDCIGLTQLSYDSQSYSYPA